VSRRTVCPNARHSVRDLPVRYHPGRDALIAIATDTSGQITGGQFIHLDRDGHKLVKAEAIGLLPRNVEWLPHGAVSGIDSFREVSRIVVVGRQAPAPAAVEACAEALTSAACTRLPSRQ
jgi:hypothetical protein